MCAEPSARSVSGMQLAIDMPGWVDILLGLPKWVVMAKWTVIATLPGPGSGERAPEAQARRRWGDLSVAAIEIQGLSKSFGAVRAVSDLSFEVNAGRVTGFLGPNGAGKSTTLRMLLGLVRPTPAPRPSAGGATTS